MWRMKDLALDGLDWLKFQKNAGTYIVLIAALGAMTFFGVCDPSHSGYGGGRGKAAVIGDQVVSQAEFNRAYHSAYDRYQRQYPNQFDAQKMALAHRVMRELVDEHALYGRAIELGLKASDDEVLDLLAREDAFKDDKGQFSDKVLQRFLEGNGYTEASFMEEVRRNVTLQKMRQFVLNTAYVSSKAAALDYRLAETKLDLDYLKFDPQKIDVNVAPAEVTKFLADAKGKAQVKEYFDANQREFNQAEQVKARHILIGYKGARNATAASDKRTKAQAKQRAEEVLAEVKKPGADFAKIAKASTDEAAGKTSGGDLGWFTRDTMEKAFSTAAFALNKGQISGVVETPFGFHIIQVEDKKAAVSTKLADAERSIAEKLIIKEKRPELAKAEAAKVLAALKANQPVDKLLAAGKVAWASTGEVGADTAFLPGIGSSKEVSSALASLATPGQLYPQALDVRGNLYILRLKSRKDADMTKFDASKKRELALSAAYTDANALFTDYEQRVRSEIETKDKVWVNPDYLAMDNPQKDSSGG